MQRGMAALHARMADQQHTLQQLQAELHSQHMYTAMACMQRCAVQDSPWLHIAMHAAAHVQGTEQHVSARLTACSTAMGALGVRLDALGGAVGRALSTVALYKQRMRDHTAAAIADACARAQAAQTQCAEAEARCAHAEDVGGVDSCAHHCQASSQSGTGGTHDGVPSAAARNCAATCSGA